MAEIHHNARLNSFVVSIGHSLLQYADESWPWTASAEAEIQAVLRRLAALQRQEVETLVEVLDQRGWTIDFGTYPTDYTDLQYLSLDYLLSGITSGERAILADLDEAAHACVDDSAADEVLKEVLATQRKIVERLEAVAKSRSAAVAAS